MKRDPDDESMGPRHVPEGRTPALLELAKALGNVSEACRRLGVDRSAYYRALRRQRAGEAGKALRPPLAKSPQVENKLLALCLEYPDWGCDRLALYLTLKGDAISSPTAQKILIRHGLGRAAARCAAATRIGEAATGRQ